ncbi:MAG: B12-binding domain-containing radical SAM protein [Thermodesulfobacteriota bacterium]
MKALLLNPSFPPSFWSLKETCRVDGTKGLAPPLGLITMAALLPPEWELRLVDLNVRTLPAGAWDWADLVMVSGMLVQREGLLSLVREAKARGKTVVAGGPYATSLPQEVLDAGADFLFRGEAENTMPLFLAALTAGESRGVFQADAKPEMSDSPPPRFDILDLEDYTVMSIQTSRGCPYDCEFCDVVNLYGRKPRYKKPEQVLAELEALYRLGWRRAVFISDDNFIGNRQHALAILEQLTPWMKSHGEPYGFWTQASLNLGQDLELIDRMTAANFSYIFVGVESTDAASLGLSRKYHNLRNPLAESLKNINKNGLSVVASFIIGFDGEEKGAGERICAFVEENHIPVVMVNLLQAAPQTSLWRRLKEEGRLLEGTLETGDLSGKGMNFIPTRAAEEIMEEYLQATARLCEPTAFLQRAFRAILHMRPTRRALGIEENRSAASPPPASSQRIIKVNGFMGLLRLIWRQGMRAPYRGQFWRQLAAVIHRNPSRKVRYLSYCGLGETLFAYPGLVRKNLASAREDRPSARQDAV